MANMDFGQTSINEEIGISIDRAKAISIDKSTGISVDNAHQTSIDNTPPEAGKYSLTNDANERVVLGKPKGQLSNANKEIIGEQGTEIPVQIKSISERDNEWKLPLQDYLNPGRSYSNRSAIRLPKDNTKRFGISPEYLIMARQNPFRGTVSERAHDHIEYLEEYLEELTLSFFLRRRRQKMACQIPTGSLTCPPYILLLRHGSSNGTLFLRIAEAVGVKLTLTCSTTKNWKLFERHNLPNFPNTFDDVFLDETLVSYPRIRRLSYGNFGRRCMVLGWDRVRNGPWRIGLPSRVS
ncbi:hypothetical protein F2Q69_00027601 [Brassica cretica]|uniref:Uncharacterized protein n=1 Tax=Brassica cretica TaxID=69181 RepID=A0A8S9S9R8_BRACR|nr:hypothetical protein F2Q69_00027601 [Brassica cretica]